MGLMGGCVYLGIKVVKEGLDCYFALFAVNITHIIVTASVGGLLLLFLLYLGHMFVKISRACTVIWKHV